MPRQEMNKTPQGQIDKGLINPRAVLKVMVELVYRVSNGTLPQGLTKPQIKQWIKDNI